MPNELNPESQHLHDLMQPKNKAELAGVDYMSRHPLSRQQKLEQKARIEKQIASGESVSLQKRDNRDE
ncbi:MAG: hypothetical protein IPG95_11195 [Saprospiraceae bacterium]|nr:hypothetical protein [Saprospiraceae bacterium]